MVDKIDKTTLKILLFIVFLVILYLMVNRKTQIKEGFFFTLSEDQAKAKWMLEEVTKIILKEGIGKTGVMDVGIVLIDGYQKQENSTNYCLRGSVYEKKRGELKAELLKNLRENISKITLKKKTSGEMRTTAEMKAEIISKLSTSYSNPRTPSSIINSTTLPEARGRDDDNVDTPYHYGNTKSGRSSCDIYVTIAGFIYKNKTQTPVVIDGQAYIHNVLAGIDNDDAFFKLIENNFVYADTDTFRELGNIKTTLDAEKAAAVTTLNNKKKEVIQSYLDLLVDNGIVIAYKIVGDIIDTPDFSNINDTLEQNLYTAMKDYYNSVISTHPLTTDININSCTDVGKKDLSLEDCQAFRRLYVPTREESSETNFGTYPGISKMTTGVNKVNKNTIFRFTKEKDYVYSPDGWDWLSKGCQYRHEKDNHEYNGLYYSKNAAIENADHISKRPNLTLLCKEKEEEYKPSINPIEDAVTALLNRKKAISIGKQYLNIFKKIIEGYDFGDDEKIFDQIIEELKTYHKINKEDMAKSDDTEFIYPNCEAAGKVSLNYGECSNFRKEYVSHTTTAKDNGYGSMLTDNTNKHFKEDNEYMRLGVDNGNWMPKGCSYRAGGGDKGIHYSDNDPDYSHKNTSDSALAKYSHISKFDLFCNDYDINKLKNLSTQITNNNNLKNILTSILALLNTITPLNDVEINVEINNLQSYVDIHLENEKEKLTRKERITLENSFNLI
mgnify:CR=1 FL=1|tara:strand:+ start:355 stop:2529 length:2175 start_codon:yes stop_codon:yes gene_type:complete